MTKVEREVVFNSENGQKEMTGVRHSDDDVKKKVIDCVFKLGQLNNSKYSINSPFHSKNVMLLL